MFIGQPSHVKVSKEVSAHQIITQQQFLLLIHIIVWLPVVGIDRTSMSHI
jgi:hypothetical protein